MKQQVTLEAVLTPRPRASLDPNEKRIALLRVRTTDPIGECLRREMEARGLRTVSNMLHTILLERYQIRAQSGLPCPHPILSALESARQAAAEALADGAIQLHETPAIQKPIVQAEQFLWNPPEAA